MGYRTVQVHDGLVRIEQRLDLGGEVLGTDVAGPACIFGVVVVRRGTVTYLRGRTRVRAPRRFALVVPPFGIAQASLAGCDVTSAAVAFRPPAFHRLPREPLLLPAGDGAPASIAEALERIRTAAGVTPIGRAIPAPRLASHAKSIIDRGYRASLSIASVASRLHTSPAGLSRAFRRMYGMPPVRYRHHVRVMEALVRLAEGAVPVEVFQDVGFDDLSRFYKVFRAVTCAAPGSYRPRRSRIAKT